MKNIIELPGLRMTPFLKRLFILANGARLPNPLGRAVALLNRHYNDGRGFAPRSEELAYLRRIRPKTATRWLQHYLDGGSIKTLLRSAKEESERRRAAYVKVKNVINAYRRKEEAK